jgi:hypothetical protein
MRAKASMPVLIANGGCLRRQWDPGVWSCAWWVPNCMPIASTVCFHPIKTKNQWQINIWTMSFMCHGSNQICKLPQAIRYPQFLKGSHTVMLHAVRKQCYSSSQLGGKLLLKGGGMSWPGSWAGSGSSSRGSRVGLGPCTKCICACVLPEEGMDDELDCSWSYFPLLLCSSFLNSLSENCYSCIPNSSSDVRS